MFLENEEHRQVLEAPRLFQSNFHIKMSVLRLLLLLAANVHFTSALDDGLARTPPMGWRSWNAFHEKIDQNLLSTVIDKISEHLAPLGFTDVGIDDNWQKCSENAATGRGGFHDPETGAPIVDEKRFWELDPATQQRVGSMRPIVDTAHAKNLTIGWYLNNCMCAETDLPPETARRNLQGDVKALFEYGFDGVKLDGCGQNTDLAAWVAEIQARAGSARTGKITIENCHWGGDLQISAGGAGSGAQMGRAEKRVEVLATSSASSSNGNRASSSTTCPYHFARTSFDIGPSWRGVYLNLQTLSRSPAGRPHCWNYPDMLEVGNHRETDPLRFDQAHFSMWAATSSPLILSFDVRKLGGRESSSYYNELLGRVLSNEAAISVNQLYANDAGRLVFSWEPTPNAAFPWSLPCDPFDGGEQRGWFLANGTSELRWRSAEAEFCLDSQTGTDPVLVMLVPCASLAPGGERRFRYDAETGELVRSKRSKDVGSFSNTTEECVKQFEAGFELTTDRTHCRSFFLSEQGKLFQRTSTTEPSMLDHRCVGVKTSAPLSANTLQLWTKKLPVPTADHASRSSMMAEELDPSRGSVDPKRRAARLDELLAAASRKERKAEMRLTLSSKKPDVVEQTIVARQAVLLLNADATAEHPFNFSPGVLERLFGPSEAGTRFVIYDLWARDLSPASVGADDYVVNIPGRGCRFFVFQKIKDGSAEVESRPTAVDIYA